MRHTRAHTRNRRSHHALVGKSFTTCTNCGAQHLRHHVCMGCGQYRGRVVVDVMAKKTKLLKKKADARKAKSGTSTKAEEKEEKTEKSKK
jgi:large subunit ribosomal protein L32